MIHGARMKRFIAVVLTSLAWAAGWTAVDGVAALHAKVITPASNELFQAESTPPTTAQAWQKIRASAVELEQAGARLASQDLAKDSGQWLEFARALQKQAAQAVVAADKQDQDALVSANGDVISVCEDCHTKYRDAGRSMKQ